jgi:chromosome segregation ATPase
VESDLNSANTEIEAANEEITELEDQNASLSEQLGQSEEFAAALDQVLGAGTTAADSLYECAVTAYEFVLNSLNSGVPDVGQAQAVDDRCLSAEDNYNAFNAAINELAEA